MGGLVEIADARYAPLLRLGVEESSTSLRSDWRKLGPAVVVASGDLARGTMGTRAALDDSPVWSAAASARSWGLLVLGRFNRRSG